MDFKDEQKNIHVNPDFITRRGQTKAKSKVHVNPAFLHKSQAAEVKGKIVRDANPLIGHNSFPYMQDFHSRKIDQVKHEDKQRPNDQHRVIRKSDLNVSQLRKVSCNVYNVNNAKSNTSIASKTDHQKYKTNTSIILQDLRVRPTHCLTSYNKSKVTQASAYSWTTAGAKLQTYPQDARYPTQDEQALRNTMFSSNSSAHKFPYQGELSRDRLSKYTNHLALSNTTYTRENKFKINKVKKVDPSELDRNTLCHVTKSRTSFNTEDSGKLSHNLHKTKVSNASESNNQETYGSKSSVGVAAANKPEPKKQEIENSGSFVGTETFPQITRSSNILINPRLLNYLSSNSGQDLRSTVSSKLQSIFPPPNKALDMRQIASFSNQPNSNVTKAIVEIPKKNGKYKIISKTKLVRRRSGSYSSNGPGNDITKKTVSESTSFKLPQNSTRVANLYGPSLKFPGRHHKCYASTKMNLKKRYSVLSSTKLVRCLSSPNGTNGEKISGKPKYSVKTKTKLIRRQHGTVTNDYKSFPKVEELKARAIKPDTERRKKFSVLSKTKLVRRRSNSGIFKTIALKNPVSSDLRVRTIIRRHKVVRNVPSAQENYGASKMCGEAHWRNVYSTYHIVKGGVKLSAKQKAAKGIISKYKINRLKSESPEIVKKRLSRYISKSDGKHKFSYMTRKGGISKCSDRIINIGGILYKSTKTSLRKQLLKTSNENIKRPSDSTCIVWLRGDQFQLSARGRTLKRIKNGSDSLPSKHSLSRVHIGGLTYSRTKAGQYELTKIHQTRAVLSSAKHRSLITLAQRKKKGTMQKRNEYCIFFNRFGRCTKKNRGECPYLHDPKRVAVCTRFLRGRCPVNNCPFSHTVDPDKMPVCSHFVQASCTRDGCPYRHVRVNPSAPVCLDFLKGHCLSGEECKKQHILVCEEFSRTGKCSRGMSCPLSHHKAQTYRKSIILEHPEESIKKFNCQYRKRKKSESRDVLGGPKMKRIRERKSKGNRDKIVQQRYFQVMKLENDYIEEPGKVSEVNKVDVIDKNSTNSEIIPSDDRGNEGKPGTNQSYSASSISLREKVKTKMQWDNKGEDKTRESSANEPSTDITDLEETRQRLLKKVDKMKCSYTTYKDIVGVQNCALNFEANDIKGVPLCNEVNQPRIVGDEVQDLSAEINGQYNGSDRKECEMDSPNSGSCRSRMPLPRRLPSYIPLSLSEDIEDL